MESFFDPHIRRIIDLVKACIREDTKVGLPLKVPRLVDGLTFSLVHFPNWWFERQWLLLPEAPSRVWVKA
jgi:hypothetical protein